jgi:sugar lactone lactonase YvrE
MSLFKTVGQSITSYNMATYNVYTIAGSGTAAGFGGNGGLATSALLNNPWGLFVDSIGNLYISDFNNHVIRFVPKVTGTYFGVGMTGNYIYTIAGTGTLGYSGDSGVATSAQLNHPAGLCLDSLGNVYIADTYNYSRIRFIPKKNGTYFGVSMIANYIYTIAGTGAAGFAGDGGAATSAQINVPNGICVDSLGNLYIGDTQNNRIRMIAKTSNQNIFGISSTTANYIYTIAGNGTGAFAGDSGAATSAQLRSPMGICSDSVGNIYIADYLNTRIRFVAKTSGTYFGISMTANYIYTIAGGGTQLGDNGLATNGQLNRSYGICLDSIGNLYITDSNNNRIRFVAKTDGQNIFGISSTIANYIYTIAGTGTGGFAGDNGLATSANLKTPTSVYVDSVGNLCISDSNNHRIRMIAKTDGQNIFGISSTTANYIYTIAGSSSTGAFAGDGGLATNAQLNIPNGICLDLAGTLYIADSANNVIRFMPSFTVYNDTSVLNNNNIFTPNSGYKVNNTDIFYYNNNNNNNYYDSFTVNV